MALSIGQTLDERYLIEAHIGSGGMARVFRARNQRSGKLVAVKEIYLPANEQADTLRGWLRREIKALMVLDHPNVVTLIDHGETIDGTPWVVTELLDGADLEDWVQQFGPLGDAAVIDVALQALGAFKTAHDLSIVHRDIKPGNLFLCNNGRVVVLDFGLARALSGEVSRTLAEGFGTKIMGTPQYWSPEQIRGVTLDMKSDIFSLGGSLYFLLSGKPPFVGNTAFEIASQIMMKQRAPLQQAAPSASPALAALIEDMLAEESDTRANTTELLSRFEALAAKLPNTRPALMAFIAKRTQAQPARLVTADDNALHASAAQPSIARAPESEPEVTAITSTEATTTNTKAPAAMQATQIVPQPAGAKAPAGEAARHGTKSANEAARSDHHGADATRIGTQPSSDATRIAEQPTENTSHARSAARVARASATPDRTRSKARTALIAAAVIAALAGIGAVSLAIAWHKPPQTAAPLPVPLPPAPLPSPTTVATALPAPAEPPPVPTPMPVDPPVIDKPATTDKPKAVAPEPAGNGTLSVTLKQWAEVIVDGQSQGKKQIGAKLVLPSGKHEVVFKNAKFGERKTSVTIRANKETTLGLDFEAQQP